MGLFDTLAALKATASNAEPPASPTSTDPGPETAHPPIAPWDQAEADRLLAEVRQTAARLEAQHPGGRFPKVLGRVVADLLAVAKDYAAGHEQEAARRWDAMELLRGVRPELLKVIERHRQEQPASRPSPDDCAPAGQPELFARDGSARG
jgi:hypothetical protein